MCNAGIDLLCRKHSVFVIPAQAGMTDFDISMITCMSVWFSTEQVNYQKQKSTWFSTWKTMWILKPPETVFTSIVYFE
jgi:hypothetical protein